MTSEGKNSPRGDQHDSLRRLLMHGKSSCRTLSRWAGYRGVAWYEWQRHPNFWVMRARSISVCFYIGKWRFGLDEWLRSRHESLSIFRQILSTVVGPGLLAILLVFGLEVCERVLSSIGSAAFLTRWLPFLSAWPPVTRKELDWNTYSNLLSTVTQIAGVFLGLHFTAVSVVTSTIYARVQGNVRDLLVREKVGNFYIRTVALLTAVGILLLTLSTFKIRPGILNLLLICVLGITAPVSFVVLGLRAFYFLDPALLTHYLGEELKKSIRSVTPGGFRWADPTFQGHYQRRAEEALRTYRDVVLLSDRKESHQGRPLVDLALRLLYLYRGYAREKCRIPSDSQWFPRTHRHREWLMAGSTQVEMALSTGTSLQPEAIQTIHGAKER